MVKTSRWRVVLRPVSAALLALASLAPGYARAAPPRPVLDLSSVISNWTAFGWFGDWAVFSSPVDADPKVLPETAQAPPLAVALTGTPLPGLGAYVECRPWICGTSLQFGILLGHDVYRSYPALGYSASEPRTRVLLEPDAGFSQETDAVVAVAEGGYPLQISMLLSVLLPDGRPFQRAMRESSTLLSPDALGEIRRSNVLRIHLRHADGTSRVHDISLWGFSNALDVLELKCRHSAQTLAARTRQACRRVLEMDDRR